MHELSARRELAISFFGEKALSSKPLEPPSH